MASSSTDNVDTTLSELAALRLRLAEGSQEADVELIDETSEHLEFLRSEVARLKAQVRWLEGKPYRSKPEKVAPEQLAFGLIEMMKGGLDNDEEPANDDETRDIEFAGDRLNDPPHQQRSGRHQPK